MRRQFLRKSALAGILALVAVSSYQILSPQQAFAACFPECRGTGSLCYGCEDGVLCATNCSGTPINCPLSFCGGQGGGL